MDNNTVRCTFCGGYCNSIKYENNQTNHWCPNCSFQNDNNAHGNPPPYLGPEHKGPPPIDKRGGYRGPPEVEFPLTASEKAEEQVRIAELNALIREVKGKKATEEDKPLIDYHRIEDAVVEYITNNHHLPRYMLIDERSYNEFSDSYYPRTALKMLRYKITTMNYYNGFSIDILPIKTDDRMFELVR